MYIEQLSFIQPSLQYHRKLMTSIDLRDAQVQHHFTSMRKTSKDTEKQTIAQQIARMYQSNEQYSYGIFTRIIKFISQSNDKQQKKIGLIVLSSLGRKMQGTARSIFVNKFHSPVFKLFQTSTEQSLIYHIEQAYSIVLQMGGNRNDSAVQNNLSSCFSILQNGNVKDVKKIGVYSVLKILVLTSPYITFKKLLQKQKNSNLDNLSLIIASAKVKNIKIRTAYLNFLVQYVKYIAEKKDNTFQKSTFERLFENYSLVSAKQTNEEINHLYIESVNIFLTYLNHTIPADRIRIILEYSLQKMQNNKSQIIEWSIIKLLPKLAEKKPADQIISNFLKYLRTMEGQTRLIAQQAINLILENAEKREHFLPIYKDILSQILTRLKSYIREQSYNLTIQIALIHIKTIDILLKKFKDDYYSLISKQKLQELVSYAMLIGLDEQIIKLIADIIKFNIHSLGRVLEIKFILTLSKILTGSTRKLLRDINAEFKIFIELLDSKDSSQFLQTQINKIKAIQALSSFRFRQQFRDVVGGFVRDCVLKDYLEWGNSRAKMASVQAAFFLYPKKGKNMASNHMLQILDKLLRVGINDEDENVREKVFTSIVKNFKRHEQFIQFFTCNSLLNSLFKSFEDRNQNIKIQTLKIICILYKKNPSVYITPYLNQYLYKCFYHLSSNFKYFSHKYYLIKSIVVIIEYAPSIIQNHIDNLLKLLLNYLSDQDNYEGLQELFFQLIKTLSVRLPNTILPYADQFSYHLVEAMKDKLNTKYRLIALKTFLSIIKQCGYVVIPYFQIPSLKSTLAFLIRSEIEEQSRIDIMKIIGALGIFDNLRFSMIEEGRSGSTTSACLMKSLARLNVRSSFLDLRDRLVKEKENNRIERQLKQYYDELILLQNNKRLILISTKDNNYDFIKQRTTSDHRKLQLEIDSPMNFNMFILKTLFQILEDKSLEEKHSLTLDVLAQLLEMMGSQLQRELPKIMELLLQLIKENQQILSLIYILGQKCDISAFVGEIVNFVISHTKNIETTIKILSLVTAKYTSSLRHHIELIIDKLYAVIEHHSSNSRLIIDISFIYQNIKLYIEPYLGIILPQLLDKFFKSNSEITNSFIDFVMQLARCCPSILQFMPVLTHHFCLLLNLCGPKHNDCKPCLRNKICNCIVLFVTLFKKEFVTYLPMLHRSILKGDYPHELYFKAVRYLEICSFGNINNIFTEEEMDKINPEYRNSFNQKMENPKYSKRIDGIEELIHQFDPLGKKIIDEDWVEWLKKNSILLLKKSPNFLLKTCSVLADEYNELGLQLYNISFYHLWEVLVDDQKKILLDNIKRILTSNPKPFLLVRKTFLNLAEFMNRKKCAFELSSALLAECAGESSCFAKQLYYKEQEFQANPEKTIEGMIDTYMKLGEPQNAYGLFSIAACLDIECKIEWYKKIGKFEQAYKSYREMPEQKFSGEKLKCLSHISDDKFVSQFEKMAKNKLNFISKDINNLAIQAYCHLEQWEKFEHTLQNLQPDNLQKSFWTSILQIKQSHYDQALVSIKTTRKHIYEEIPDLMNFSSTSEAFDKLITLQQLFELEEIVELKQREQKIKAKIKEVDEAERTQILGKFDSHCNKLRNIWNDRLIGCYKTSSTYRKLSTVRSLIFNRCQYFQFYFQFCELYIREKKITKCQQLIEKMKVQLTASNMKDKLKLVHLLEIKLNFSANLIKQMDAILKIQTFLEQHVHLNPTKIGQLYYISAMTLYENKYDSIESQQKILSLIKKSAQLCNTYKEWYIFSTINLQFAETSQKQELVEKYISNALYSLTNSLKITANQNQFYLQGYLKLLSLLCMYSRIKSIYIIFEQQYKNIPVQGWINVVPQMIAQLYQLPEESNFVKILKFLLKQLGQRHPQSVLFSLNFALKSKIEERVKPALEIVEHIRLTHSELADQVQQISGQLCRAAIKLKQYWYDGIESAWAAYNQNKNSAQVIATLKQICENVLNRKQSNSELAFHQEYGQELRDGYSWLLRFQRTQESICISQVFDLFYGIYKKVKDSFQNVKKVYLKNVAPFLVTSKKYKSTIPGLYEPNKNCVKITGFCNELVILQSKQRPRKLIVYGDDQKQYNFLLKGRQDLRLDERVMQFFSLVNKLLASQRQNLKRNLQITRYSIIPLTVNTGLIGWVQNCDTLNELIKEHRTINKIRVYVQKQLYEKICPDYAYLPAINKLQIFKNGLQSTQGKDLQKILWLKSPNSQAWVETRNNYTCSLATMSIVGYILGLGDRHPSNIMLQRNTGKVVHIDFGDCFEVAVLRQKFPERVPFRLTRMLQKAMGVPGIHGLFKFTCQMVMKILRENKESLFGVLETFAQDPIISWRLTNQKKEEKQAIPGQINKNINDEIIGSIMEGLQIEMTKQKQNSEIQDESPRRTINNVQNNQQINQKAVKALLRVKQKLKGNDFKQNIQLSVEQQVSKLIQQATSSINICQSWPGWCPFW